MFSISQICIGIGGSYLGIEFVMEALKTDATVVSENLTKNRNIKFLANVDPIDVRRALTGLDPKKTLAIVMSKTFTTAETMLNARTVKQWLVDDMGSEACIAKHMVDFANELYIREDIL